MHVESLPEAGFLRIHHILRLIPVGRSTWWAGVKRGVYPAPVRLGVRCTAWKCEDIAALSKRIAASKGEP